MREAPKKLAFVFGDVTFTLTPDDVEAVMIEWLRAHPGKTERDMPPDEFAARMMDRLKANARPTRTVLHN